MKEKGILFSAPMVRAILAGKKTITRRLASWPILGPSDGAKRRVYGSADLERERAAILACCPQGRPGDRLWVRETHAQFSVGEGLDRDVPQCVAYRATCAKDGGFDYVNGREEVLRLKVSKWRPAIFMPRWASRITLEVTGVRLERLQDISEDDAKAEGLTCLTKDGGRVYKWGIPDRDGWPGNDDDGSHWHEWCVKARDAFAKLWDKINGERAAWSSNPWVWAVSFRVVEQEARL